MNKKKLSIIILSSLLATQLSFSYEAKAKDLHEVKFEEEQTSIISHQTHVKGSKEQLSKVNLETMRFIKSIALDAYKSGNESNLFPSVTIAQAVLESNKGESKLSKEPNNNLFGIKGYYKGESVDFQTLEDDGEGNHYEIYSNFRKYPSKLESIKDHDRLLQEGLDGYYRNTWRDVAKTAESAAKALEGTYATDTSYSSKLISIIEDYNLKRFDKELTKRDYIWLSSESLDPWELPIDKEAIKKEEDKKKQMQLKKNKDDIINFFKEKGYERLQGL